MPGKSERLKSPKWHFPQVALFPTGPRPRLKSPNCRYTIFEGRNDEYKEFDQFLLKLEKSEKQRQIIFKNDAKLRKNFKSFRVTQGHKFRITYCMVYEFSYVITWKRRIPKFLHFVFINAVWSVVGKFRVPIRLGRDEKIPRRQTSDPKNVKTKRFRYTFCHFPDFDWPWKSEKMKKIISFYYSILTKWRWGR